MTRVVPAGHDVDHMTDVCADRVADGSADKPGD
jgi:hypothetical protein